MATVQRKKTGRNETRRGQPARLEARISAEQKELFQQAASIQHRTLTDFVISTLQEAASRILQEREIMVLSLRDREIFVDALLNPAPPNEKLRAAARDYKKWKHNEG